NAENHPLTDFLKLVIHPAVDDGRLARIVDAAGAMRVINARELALAETEIADADAYFGTITPDLLRRATQLRWVQAPTSSLEHYLFPELVAHPCTLSNMRGLFSDVIADHVLGYVICFARNFHRYIRQQMRRHWEPFGGESERTTFAAGPGVTSAIDRNHPQLSDATMGIIGVGHIGAEIARRARAFG